MEEEEEAGGGDTMHDLLVWHYWAIPHRERGRWRDNAMKAGAFRAMEGRGKKKMGG